jgi:phospholipase C
MENESAPKIYGSPRAPFINGSLTSRAARATNFSDELPGLLSAPHYVWMEAGTNAFADHVFTTDENPSPSNVTASTAHLATQLSAAGQSWIAYQEGMTAGTCPIASVGNFRPRHDPFVYFTDIVGAPPSTTAPECIAHHRPFNELAGDLASGNLGSYNFITPDLCHDMHGSPACPPGDLIRAGDDWLSVHLPPLIDFVNLHGGVVFLVWDEGTSLPFSLPFLVAGPHVKAGYASPAPLNHSSLLKTIELLLGVDVLPAVAAAPDLQDLFEDQLPAAP